MAAGYNQYAPMPGVQGLREVISEKIASLHHYSYHPETEITVTAGASQAIYTIISAFISKGDEVIILKPAYDCYEPSIELQGGVPVLVQLQPNFTVNWKEVAEKINPKTKMIVINTPHNPSGAILSLIHI